MLGKYGFLNAPPEVRIHLRRQMLKFFTTGKIKNRYFEIFVDSAKRITRNFNKGIASYESSLENNEDKNKNKSNVFDLQQSCYEFTFDSFCKIGLNREMHSLDGDLSDKDLCES